MHGSIENEVRRPRKLSKNQRKPVTERRQKPERVLNAIFVDFGAVLGIKMITKSRKNETKANKKRQKRAKKKTRKSYRKSLATVKVGGTRGAHGTEFRSLRSLLPEFPESVQHALPLPTAGAADLGATAHAADPYWLA